MANPGLTNIIEGDESILHGPGFLNRLYEDFLMTERRDLASRRTPLGKQFRALTLALQAGLRPLVWDNRSSPNLKRELEKVIKGFLNSVKDVNEEPHVVVRECSGYVVRRARLVKDTRLKIQMSIPIRSDMIAVTRRNLVVTLNEREQND